MFKGGNIDKRGPECEDKIPQDSVQSLLLFYSTVYCTRTYFTNEFNKHPKKIYVIGIIRKLNNEEIYSFEKYKDTKIVPLCVY